jgi:hypothetical protein
MWNVDNAEGNWREAIKIWTEIYPENIQSENKLTDGCWRIINDEKVDKLIKLKRA